MSCADFHNMSWLLMWILEDYGTNNWSLKLVADKEELFGHMDIKVGSELCDEKYRVIIVHLEWNLIFLIGKDRTLIAYEMDDRKVHVIHACVIRLCRSRGSFHMNRHYYLSYAPLSMQSLAE